MDDGELFDEISCVKKYLSMEKIHEWGTKKTPVDRKWVEIFAHFTTANIPHGNISKIVELCFCMPASNAPTERIFSWMNNPCE